MVNFFRRIKNRLYFEKLKLAVRSIGNLEKKLGTSFTDLPAEVDFEPDYKKYVTTISRADMAASLELSNVMYALCLKTSPAKLLDMGSGFSSFIFRSYAAKARNCQVWSVDDDALWLDKTKDYLQASTLQTDNLLTLEKFIESKERDFDITLLDLNYVEVRKNYIKLVIDRCSSGGIIVFDDVHKREFLTEVVEQSKGFPVKLYDLSSVTKDQFGRFAMLAIKY